MASLLTYVSSGFEIVVGSATGDETQFTITGPGGRVQTYTGSGFTYDNGIVTGGTIDSTSLSIDGVAQYDLVELGLPMEYFGTILFDGDAETVRRFLLELNDGLVGAAGDDYLNGYNGDDTLFGGDGNDILVGGAGTDTLEGGDGDDVFLIGAGSDHGFRESIQGGAGYDVIRFTSTTAGDQFFPDRDFFFDGGMTGVEAIVISDAAGDTSGTTALDVNARFVVVNGGLTIIGNDGANFIGGTIFTDSLVGNGGDDTLSGGSGDDTLDGGAGIDTVINFGAPGPITVDLAAGFAFDGGGGTDTLINIENADGSDNDDTLIGDGVVNVLQGGGGNDTLQGGWGNDTLHGGSGNDALDGGVGHDAMYGGAGDDIYYFDFGGDTAIEAAGEGTDTVIASIGIDLSANVENLVVVATVAGYGGGNALDNIITGSAVGDYLVGYAGSDTLYGGAGFDWLRGYEGDDFLYGESDDDDLFGFTGNDYLSGGEGNDRLDGGAGQDTMAGGAGDDYYAVDDADVLIEGAGEGTDIVESSVASFQLADHFENLTLVASSATGFGNGSANTIIGGDGSNFIDGRGGDDTLFGGDGFDSLYGGDGNDVLDGGAGNDEMVGQAGDDTYHFARGGGYDVAWEFMGTAEDMDIVLLSADIAPSDVSVEYIPATQPYYNDGGFLLRVDDGAGGTLKIVWSPSTGPEIEIEQVVFADGTIWDEAALVAQAIANGDAPVLASPLADQAAAEDAPFSYVVPAEAFADNELLIGDSLAYSASLADGSALPSWLSFDESTRTFSGTSANEDVGAISVRVTATDQSGQGASDVFDIAVANTNDAPVLANASADQSARDTVAFLYVAAANAFADADAGDEMSYAATLENGASLPAWLDFDAATRTFSGTPGAADIGTFSVLLAATDGAGAQAFDVFAIIVGAAPDQTITGTAGNDTLSGASGNDTIDGLGGADTMSGSLGDDLYYVRQSGDVVIESSGAGTDTVRSSVTHVLATNVENLELIGTAAINGTGNALDNVLSGNAAKNRLSGGAGNDTYLISQSGDTVVENSGAGTDAVHASVSYTLGNHVENLLLTGSGSINGTGNGSANWITGNSGNNTLKGNGGADALSGGLGSDILTGGSGIDAFYFFEAPGVDADRITDFAAGERLYLEDLAHLGIGAEGAFAPDDERFFAAPGASSGADATDRVIYDTAAGKLYYDVDGSGAGESALIAVVGNAFALSAADIFVI